MPNSARLVRAPPTTRKTHEWRDCRAVTTKTSKPKGNFGRGQNCLLANDLKKIHGEPAEPSKMPQWIDFG